MAKLKWLSFRKKNDFFSSSKLLHTLVQYYVFNSFGAKFQTTFVVCFFYCNKLSFGKTFICKVERLNVKQRRSRWDGSLSRLIWSYVVCKSLLLSPVAVKELMNLQSIRMCEQLLWDKLISPCMHYLRCTIFSKIRNRNQNSFSRVTKGNSSEEINL